MPAYDPDDHGLKWCPQCGEMRPLADYGKNHPSRDGLTAWCLPCKRAWERAWRASHLDQRRASNLRYYYKLHPPRSRGVTDANR